VTACYLRNINFKGKVYVVGGYAMCLELKNMGIESVWQQVKKPIKFNANTLNNKIIEILM